MFLRRDCAGGAGPTVDVPSPTPPAPVPAVVVFAASDVVAAVVAAVDVSAGAEVVVVVAGFPRPNMLPPADAGVAAEVVDVDFPIFPSMFPDAAGAVVESAAAGADFPTPANMLPPDGVVVGAEVESVAAAAAVDCGGPNNPLDGDGAAAVVAGVEDWTVLGGVAALPAVGNKDFCALSAPVAAARGEGVDVEVAGGKLKDGFCAVWVADPNKDPDD